MRFFVAMDAAAILAFVDASVDSSDFLASDTAEEIAEKMTTALNGQTIPTTQDGTVVRLDAPATVVPPIDSPLRIGGAAPGGDITGMAFIGNTLYAVSNDDDTNFGGGGLFVVNILLIRSWVFASPVRETKTSLSRSIR